MSKWFESGNLANYAKTALLQAQKRIDQVLDIKEEDIISGQTATSSSSASQSQASSAATTINNLFSASLSKLGGGGGGETLTKSKLSSSSISSMTSKNKTAAGEEETESFFSAFLNSSSSNSTSTTTTAMNNSTSASQVANLSTFQPSGDDMEESNTASITSSTATIDEKINPPTTTKERKPKSTKMDLDKQVNLEIIIVDRVSKIGFSKGSKSFESFIIEIKLYLNSFINKFSIYNIDPKKILYTLI